jgi:hypothetical protein
MTQIVIIEYNLEQHCQPSESLLKQLTNWKQGFRQELPTFVNFLNFILTAQPL